MDKEFKDLSNYFNAGSDNQHAFSIIRERYGHSEYSATAKYDELKEKLEIIGDDDYYLVASNIRIK